MCKHRYCVMCDVTFHEEETCTSYQTRLQEETTTEGRRIRQAQENEESERLLNTSSKPCPACRRQLDKYEGCDHVICRSELLLIGMQV